MPVKTHPTAPRWDGKASRLSDFLEDVKALADTNRLPDADAIKAALRYAPSEDSEAWQYTDGSLASSWAAFVSDVLALYPGATDRQRYTFRALETLVSEQATVPMQTPSDLAQFYRRFLVASGFLVKTGRIGTSE